MLILLCILMLFLYLDQYKQTVIKKATFLTLEPWVAVSEWPWGKQTPPVSSSASQKPHLSRYSHEMALFRCSKRFGTWYIHALQMCYNCPLTYSFRERLLRPRRESADVNLLLEIKSSHDRKEHTNNYKSSSEKKSKAEKKPMFINVRNNQPF